MATSQADGGTRSGLLWEVERILDELNVNLPQILLMENVPEVIGTGNVKHFNSWLAKLESLGYTNHFKVLNAKNYGIPQNRKRCFMVSILGNCAYHFPLKIKLKYRLKDFLEENVDKRYYLSQEKIERIASWKAQQKPLESAFDIDDENAIMSTLTARGAGEEHSGMKLIKVGNYGGGVIEQEKQIYSKNSLKRIRKNLEQKDQAPTITANAMQSINHQNCVLIDETTLFAETEMSLFAKEENTKRYKNYVTWRNKKGEFNTECNRASLENDLSLTIPTNAITKVAQKEKENMRIRKLVPLECMKLMGFEEKDYQAMREIGMSDSQIYHCAGDSIVVSVLVGLFGCLLPISEKDLKQKVNDYVDGLVKGEI